MPAIQTSYPERMAIGLPGLVANMETANSITRLIQDAAGVAFGRAVFQGTGDMQVTATPGTLFKGVTIRDVTLVAKPGQTVDVLPQFYEAALHDKGVIWVTASVAVTAGAAAYVTPAGAWTNVSAGNTAIPNATFDTSAAAGAVAKLRLR